MSVLWSDDDAKREDGETERGPRRRGTKVYEKVTEYTGLCERGNKSYVSGTRTRFRTVLGSSRKIESRFVVEIYLEFQGRLIERNRRYKVTETQEKRRSRGTRNETLNRDLLLRQGTLSSSWVRQKKG